MSYYGNLIIDIVEKNLNAAAIASGYELDYLYDIYDEGINNGEDWDESLKSTVLIALELDWDDIKAPVENYSPQVAMDRFYNAGGTIEVDTPVVCHA